MTHRHTVGKLMSAIWSRVIPSMLANWFEIGKLALTYWLKSNIT